ncbi:hypothetical protein V8C86DRAFT_35057 [Haematococcus lacustris]
MAAHGDAAPPTHLVDDAPSEAASWTQRVKKKTHNVVALLNKLKTSKAVREDYRAMVDMRLKKVIIACVLCWATVSCSNMTTGQCQHTDRCFKRAAVVVPTPTISAKRLSPEQQRLIDRFFALFVATSGVPYAVCKNKWLKRALTEAGADTLSPKRLKTTLDTLYEETRLEKDAELKELLQAGVGVMLCTDGWRHRRAGHAHPLLNLVLLKPSGGCYFYDCFPLDKGAKKTAQFYADMHENLAMKVTGGDPKLLLGSSWTALPQTVPPYAYWSASTPLGFA